MYITESKEISADGGTVLVWGVSDEHGFILDFTENQSLAEEFVVLLNENKVDRQHVVEIAEDMFYSK